MGSQKIINLIMIANRKSLTQKDDTLLMIKTLVIMLMVMARIVLQLNFKLKKLNLIYEIILMHTEGLHRAALRFDSATP